MTISYVEESDDKEKDAQEQLKHSWKNIKTQPPQRSTVTVGEIIEISHDKLPPVSEKSAFMCHHNFCLKPKVDLEDADIAQEIR